MVQVGVVYHSISGSCKALAEAVAEGVNNEPGCKGITLVIEGKDIHQGRFDNPALMTHLDQCEAVVLGSPTFMGAVSAQFKAFMDAASERYSNRSWLDKLAAGFTVGGNSSGDQLGTIRTLQIFAAQMGMLWVPIDILPSQDPKGRNRSGCQSGLVTVAESAGGIHELDRLTASHLGNRVAHLASRISRL
ncbi:flavodoxin family protein [Microbulbifer sp. OS29]|uniref:Flavodoxin family protein n=1 Tax=Microbulbifer okhotskensis TaxID=2926617 RepID=A0A9X2J5E9_9GAMM|nr:flavodoxin family protein [Microbulbifer okhotskensis]MCO1334319.1 flavodoxin family protein [Microbulbifer okhotskensis]